MAVADDARNPGEDCDDDTDTGIGDDSMEDCSPLSDGNLLQKFLFPDDEARDSANGR